MACDQRKNDRKNAPFGRKLQTLANRFRRLADENLANKGITYSQLRVIAFLSRNEQEAVCQRDLEKAFEIRPSSVTSIVGNLEKNGIVCRSAAPEDARIKYISLTEKGKRLDDELKSYIRQLEEDCLSGFDQRERELLWSLLERVENNLDEIERERLC